METVGRSGVAPRPEAAVEMVRLATLRRYSILDTTAEASYDEVVRLAAQICDTPLAFVSFIDTDRQWFKARCGLNTPETPRDVAFCAHAIMQDGVMVVEDAALDQRFAENPLVTGAPFIRFYAGSTLHAGDGSALGTLCVAAPRARQLTAEHRFALVTLARQVELQLELRLKLLEVAALGLEVSRERDAVVRLEQQKRDLVGMVVHDLKSPLTCILVETASMHQREMTPELTESVETITAAAQAMHRMTVDMLDINRSEDGELTLRSAPMDIDVVMSEARSRALQRATQQGCSISMLPMNTFTNLKADQDLIGRVVENLLDNALKYGAKSDIELAAQFTDNQVIVSVSDGGPGVPTDQRDGVFKRYGQLQADHRGDSRGLGLAFCRMAIEAHGGRIWIESNEPTGSRFCFSLPIRGRRSTLPQ